MQYYKQLYTKKFNKLDEIDCSLQNRTYKN